MTLPSLSTQLEIQFLAELICPASGKTQPTPIAGSCPRRYLPLFFAGLEPGSFAEPASREVRDGLSHPAESWPTPPTRPRT